MSRASSRPLFNGYKAESFSSAGARARATALRHRVIRQTPWCGGEHARPDIVPNAGMASQNPAAELPSDASSLTTLAEQLRDGPLQRLVELQIETTALADRLGDGAPAKIEDVQQLVRLSLSAMEHFNVFTRELAAVLRELTDAGRHPH
jgi:hypothetical protein